MIFCSPIASHHSNLYRLYFFLKGDCEHELTNGTTIKNASLREDGQECIAIRLVLLLVHECIVDDYDNSITEGS